MPSYYVTETLKSVFLRGAGAGSPAVLLAYGFAVTGLGVALFSRFGRK